MTRQTPLLPRVQKVFDTGRYALLTMHRPSNVDDGRMLRVWQEALREVAAKIPVVFPVHPRTQRQLTASWGTVPMLLHAKGSYEARVNEALEVAVAAGCVASGDLVGVLAGIETTAANTDVFRLVRVR